MKDFFEKHPALRAILFTSALSLGLNFIIEILGHLSLVSAVSAIIAHPQFFLLNTLIILATLALSELFPRRTFMLIVISLAWMFLGITNSVLMVIRNSPLCGVDFYILSTGFSIITVYLTVVQIILISIGILLVIGGMVFLYRKLPHGAIKKKPALIHLLVVLAVLGVLQFAVYAGDAVPEQFPSMTDAYEEYGFVYCFTQTLLDRGIDVPEDYAEEGVEAILALLKDRAPQSSSQRPNIIVVQLESFFDLGALQSIQLSENPIPYFTQLKQTCPSGLLTVPSIGGGTANTEFELLSGMNLEFFGIGEYPYNTVLQDQTIPSLPYLLKDLGYGTHVLHNHEGSFYDRHKVYPNLGFDTFTSIEYMNGYEQNPLGWCDDSILTDQILSALRTTEASDFVFAVSVQGHGKYPNEYVSPAGGITVTGADDPKLDAQYRYYADQLRQMDDFIRELTAALSVQNEPSLLVLYGDHLPALNVEQKDLPDGQSLYQTEYVIWSTEQDLSHVKEDLESYQLGAYALQYAGIHEGAIPALHQLMRDSDCYHEWLHTLQYDMIYGKGASLPNGAYPKAKIQMGLSPILIESTWNTDQGAYFFGKGFTTHSVIQINGWNADTELVSDTMLFARGKTISNDDRVCVAQISATNAVLSRSETFTIEPSGKN